MQRLREPPGNAAARAYRDKLEQWPWWLWPEDCVRENGSVDKKKSAANITGTTYKPVQIADISLSSPANHFGESRDRTKAIIFSASCWNWLCFPIQLRSFILLICNYSDNLQVEKQRRMYFYTLSSVTKLNKFNSSFTWWTNRIRMKVWLRNY